MRVSQIDTNLRICTEVPEENVVWINVLQAPFRIHGVQYDDNQGCFVRIPQKIADSVSMGVARLNRHTAGGRVRFRTDSTCIAIRAVMENEELMPHITLIGQSGFDIYQRDPETGKEVFFHSFIPPMGMTNGFSAFVQTKGWLQDYTINLPLYDGVKELYVGLKIGCHLEKPAPYKYPKPVVYYGSSITQGGCASRPGNSYPSILSRQLEIDYMNLGFSGSAKAESKIVEYLSTLDMSVFICDYDYNAPNPEYLNKTHRPLYEAVRAAQPNLPIIFISSPTVLKEPDKYNERRQIVENTYNWAVAHGDPNVWYIDGGELFAGECWDSCTVDGCHPNDFGFYRMAMRIHKTLKPIIELL